MLDLCGKQGIPILDLRGRPADKATIKLLDGGFVSSCDYKRYLFQ